MATPAEAAVTADFSGGNSSSVVDAWQGKPGDGWQTGWTVVSNNTVTASQSVVDTSPFSSGSGNYLSANLVNQHATATRGMSIGRQYDSSVVSYSESHTVSFEFRLDTPLADLHRMYFYDKSSNDLTAEGGDTTWIIRVNPNGNIVLFDGKSFLGAPIAFSQGDVYRFTINISPSAVPAESFYTVRIDNLSQSTSYESGNLRFYTPLSSVGGYLNFYSAALVGNSYTYSLDNVSVIPEASTVALGGAGLLMLLASRRVLGCQATPVRK